MVCIGIIVILWIYYFEEKRKHIDISNHCIFSCTATYFMLTNNLHYALAYSLQNEDKKFKMVEEIDNIIGEHSIVQRQITIYKYVFSHSLKKNVDLKIVYRQHINTK